MKKTPPTLADMCVTSALDKRVWGRDPGGGTKQMVDRLLKVPRARKFVLDGPMSEFMADLHDGILSGGLRKRNVALENARQMSRSPHPLTWIEFEFPKFFDRLRFVKKYTMVGLENADQEQPAKLGWLIEQHPTNPAAFRRTEVWAGTLSGAAMMHPISLAWCSDDSPLPYPRWPLDEETSEAAVAGGYRSTQASLISTFSPDISESMLKEILRGRTLENSQYVIRNATTLQTTWALLATINDLPVTYEHVEPSKGFVARGNYRRFLKHSIVHLTVPETRYRKLANNAAAMLRRRAHQVRQHLRNDWRHPLSPACQHEYDENLTCRRCQGRKLWIAEHQRGDASLGFVTHDYEVHHDVAR
jgi:hypothetical protein